MSCLVLPGHCRLTKWRRIYRQRDHPHPRLSSSFFVLICFFYDVLLPESGSYRNFKGPLCNIDRDPLALNSPENICVLLVYSH